MYGPPLYDDLQPWLLETANRLNVEGGCFHLRSRVGDRIVCQAVTDAIVATHLSYGLDLSDCPAVRHVFATGELLSIDDAVSDGRVAPIARDRFGLQSIIYCPVHIRDATDAVAIFSHRKPHRWTDEERGIATSAVQALQATAGAARPEVRGSQSSSEAMLEAIPGLIAIVDHNLLTVATSASVSMAKDVAHQARAISVDELLRDSDRGHELKRALFDIIRRDLERFQGLLRNERGAWWVQARSLDPRNPDSAPLVAVHIQPLPAASSSVLVEEERQRLEALGRIAGSVAHEVNNALQHIGMSLEDLTGSKDDPNRAVISAATDRAAKVTRRLLTFARRGPGHLIRSELTQLVNEELDLVRRSVGPEHTFSLRFKGRAPVRIDVRKIELVLINLCRNAAEASPAGAEIVIEAGAEKFGDQEWGVLAVLDRGLGIPAEVIQNLGELQTSTKPESLGAGLGLAVVKQVADEHGGQVVMSARGDGEGSRVALLLPLDAAEETLAKPAGSPEGPRVLIVDDEPDLARMLARSLSTAGFRTRKCSSFKAAIETFDDNESWPDVIVFDINLGDGNGIELFQHARRVRPDLRFVAISGFADRDDVQPLAGSGCRLLSKPFTVTELQTEVERVLAAPAR